MSAAGLVRILALLMLTGARGVHATGESLTSRCLYGLKSLGYEEGKILRQAWRNLAGEAAARAPAGSAQVDLIDALRDPDGPAPRSPQLLGFPSCSCR